MIELVPPFDLAKYPRPPEHTPPRSSDEYVAAMAHAYVEKFFNCSAILENGGFAPGPLIGKPRAGYIVGLRHDPSIAAKVAELSSTMGDRVEGIGYDCATTHSTLVTFDASEPRNFVLDMMRLRDVGDCVAGTVKELVNLHIDLAYKGVGSNVDACILAALPTSDQLWRLRAALQVNLGSMGIHAPFNNLLHATVFRYGERVRIPVAGQLLNLCASTRFPESASAPSIFVGHYWCGGNKFELHVEEEMPLPRSSGVRSEDGEVSMPLPPGLSSAGFR